MKRNREIMTSPPTTPRNPPPTTDEAPTVTAAPSDRTIVLHLLRGAVPERADEISGLWRRYGNVVEVAPNTKGVTMNADATRIKFDTKTIDFFWLLGFSTW